MPVPRISKEDLKARLDSQEAPPPVLVDARLKYAYEHSTVTLPGSRRLSPGTDPETLGVPRDRDVVVYDSDPDEIVAMAVAATLIERGYHAAALKGGIAEWMAASLPTEAKEAPKPAAAAAATKG
jgi:rhodanese-related sulfurtransferase